MLLVAVSRSICGALPWVFCESWSSGVAGVNGGVASGLSGFVALFMMSLSVSVLGVEDGGCMLEA